MAVPRFIASMRVIALLTLVSRALGLLRDVAAAAVFGVGGVWAAFTIAFTIPNLFRRLFGEGALSAVFVPVFSQRLHVEGQASAEAAARQVFGLQLLVLGGLTVIAEGIVGVLWLTGGGFDIADPRDRLTLLLTAAMLPYLVLICGTAFLGGMLNVLRNFSIPTLAPIVLNILEIIGLGVAWWYIRSHPEPSLREHAHHWAIWAVVASVLVAGVAQAAIPYIALRRKGFRLKPAWRWDDPAVARVVRMVGPMVLGLAAVQLNTLADKLIAYFLIPSEGAPAALDFASHLYQLPLGVIGISVATAIFEQLSAEAALGQTEQLRSTALAGLRLMLFVGLPMFVGMALLAEPLVAVALQRGAFTEQDTQLVATITICYAAGMWAYMSQHIYARGFYALQRPLVPARISTWMVALNLSLNLILVRHLHECGLALATAISAYVQLYLLARAWRSATGRGPIGEFFRSLVPTAWATIGMAGAILTARHVLSTSFGDLAHLLIGGGMGATVFCILAHLMGSQEARALVAGLGRRSREPETAVAK